MSKPDTVKLTIENCGKCPHCSQPRYYTEDSFETVFEWICDLTTGRIAILDWNDKAPPIPKWCPLRESPGETPNA